MNQDAVNQTTNRKIDAVNQRLDRIDALLRSQRNIAKNNCLGPGNADPNSDRAYKPVCDDNGIFPGDSNDLQPIISLNQIETMNSKTLDSYLRFYDLASCKLKGSKMAILAKFIGIRETYKLVTIWGTET